MKILVWCVAFIFSSLSFAVENVQPDDFYDVYDLLISGEFDQVEEVSAEEFDRLFFEAFIDDGLNFKRKGKKFTAQARCPIEQIKSGPICPSAGQILYATATAKSQRAACTEAKKDVNDSLARGCKAKHCNCYYS